jgi:hypothetical protein
MSHRYLHITSYSLVIAATFLLVPAAPAPGQTSSPRAKSKTPPAGKAWTPPRTPDGRPDLEGIWSTASLTPLERLPEQGDKQFFTPEEAAAWEKQRSKEINRDRRDGSLELDAARAYNEGWFDRGTKVARNLRTSLVIDPPDGKIPPFTPEAKRRYEESHAWFAEHPADGPEDRPLFDRCLMFSQGGPPMIPGNYNNNYQIEQNSEYLAILAEDGAQVRIIPLEGRPHLPQNVSQWRGDSRGHWEGDTLVVDTTNVRFNNRSHFGTMYDGMSDDNLRITERFTRTSADTITYQATVNDPTVYTKPWTIELVMSKAEGPLFEYACHEGNYAMFGILAGARAQEKKAAEQGGR